MFSASSKAKTVKIMFVSPCAGQKDGMPILYDRGQEHDWDAVDAEKLIRAGHAVRADGKASELPAVAAVPGTLK